ncbi:MAG: xanthine dehydrogenase family protein subunit M [Anaerolineaceae bacterium]|nr:xanthine dehydrogenase family protein subunit M [Anaerolineaceae bacterium]
MIDELNYSLPSNLNDAYSQLQEIHRKPLAGATDIIPRLRRTKLPIDTLVDISRIREINFIREHETEIEIGALTTHSEITDSALLQSTAISLLEASASIGCQQTRNRGTLGGNIANASPAADTLPPLLTFDAVVHLGSLDGTREMPLSKFLLGPGKTGLAVGELIEFISFKKLNRYGLAYVKSGKRNGMSIAVASAAVAIALDDNGRIEDIRLALGSVASTALRCPRAEKILIGKPLTKTHFKKAGEIVYEDISPIDDVRASASYRRSVAAALVMQVLSIAEGRLN